MSFAYSLITIPQDQRPMSERYNESDLIEGLRNENPEVISYVYQNYKRRAFKVVLSNSGNETEAESLFHDALIVLIENIRAEKFKGDSEVATYLTGILKFKWLNELRKRGKEVKRNADYLDDIKAIEEEDVDLKNIEESQYQMLESSMSELNEDCRKLLTAYYYKNEKLKEIALEMEYTESFVRIKKLRCMNALKSIIEKKNK